MYIVTFKIKKSWILYTCIYKLVIVKSKYVASQDGKFFHNHQLDFDKHNELKLNTININKQVYCIKVLFSLPKHALPIIVI
jgi:hypothetical protein